MKIKTCRAIALRCSAPRHAACSRSRRQNASGRMYALYDLLAPETARSGPSTTWRSPRAGATVFSRSDRRRPDDRQRRQRRWRSRHDDRRAAEVRTGDRRQAKAHGLGNADLESDYIEVHLARPVPADGGQARLRIIKTYKDAKNYRRDGDGLVFDRAARHSPQRGRPARRAIS